MEKVLTSGHHYLRIEFRLFGKDTFQSLTVFKHCMHQTIWQDYPKISKSRPTDELCYTKAGKAQSRGGVIPSRDERQSTGVWEGFPEEVAFELALLE